MKLQLIFRPLRRPFAALRTRLQRLPIRLPRALSNPLFDADWYVARYTDVREARIDPFLHYRQHGIDEGRDANPFVDSAWYLARNPDLAATSRDPLDHYLRFGGYEGRDPSPRFNSGWYLATYPDVAAAGVNPLLHYLRQGVAEGRQATPPSECDDCGRVGYGVKAVDPDSGDTDTVCHDCHELRKDEARLQLVDDLRREHPSPGEEVLYQPVAAPELAGWRLGRDDSELRARIAYDAAIESGLNRSGTGPPPTYLDVGSNTGYFCDYFAERGFVASGVESWHPYVRAARTLEEFFLADRRPAGVPVHYIEADAYDYLRETSHEQVDVTSAFAVLQWIMIQHSVEAGLDCLAALAAKTRRVSVIELPYTDEETYGAQVGATIDRGWVEHALRTRAGFAEIRHVAAAPGGLQRDLFIGFKH